MPGLHPAFKNSLLPHVFVGLLMLAHTSSVPAQGDRLAHLDTNDPYHVGLDSPKLITPQ